MSEILFDRINELVVHNTELLERCARLERDLGSTARQMDDCVKRCRRLEEHDLAERGAVLQEALGHLAVMMGVARGLLFQAGKDGNPVEELVDQAAAFFTSLPPWAMPPPRAILNSASGSPTPAPPRSSGAGDE